MEKAQLEQLTLKYHASQQNLFEQNKQLQQQQEEIQAQQFAIEQSDALNAIHSEKIRSLLNSIQILKKQKLDLEKQQKDHKRSELINKLNKEIAEQDLIIEALRNLVNDDEKSDKTILKILNRGPPKLRAETREELRIQLKKVNGKLSQTIQSKEQTYIQQEASQKEQINYSQSSLDQSTAKSEFNEDLVDEIDNLKQQNQELKLNIQAIQSINEKQNQDLQKKVQELFELKNIKSENQLLLNKFDQLQKKIEKVKDEENTKTVFNFDRMVRLEELELLNKTYDNKIQSLEKQLQMEKDIIKQKLNEINVKKKIMMEENSNMQTKIKLLNEQIDEKLSEIERQQQYINFQKQQNDELLQHEKEIKDEYENQLQDKVQQIQALQAENLKLYEKNNSLQERIEAQDSKILTLQKQLYLTTENKQPNDNKKNTTQEQSSETNIELIKDDKDQQRKTKKIAELNKQLSVLQSQNLIKEKSVTKNFDSISDISIEKKSYRELEEDSKISDISHSIQDTNSNFEFDQSDINKEKFIQENKLIIQKIEQKQKNLQQLENKLGKSTSQNIIQVIVPKDKDYEKEIIKIANEIGKEEIKNIELKTPSSSNVSQDSKSVKEFSDVDSNV